MRRVVRGDPMASTTETSIFDGVFEGQLFAEGDAHPSIDGSFGNIFDGVLAARRQEVYDAGYRRAVNDLLAEFVLISEEYIRRYAAHPELRQVLRAFEESL